MISENYSNFLPNIEYGTGTKDNTEWEFAG